MKLRIAIAVLALAVVAGAQQRRMESVDQGSVVAVTIAACQGVDIEPWSIRTGYCIEVVVGDRHTDAVAITLSYVRDGKPQSQSRIIARANTQRSVTTRFLFDPSETPSAVTATAVCMTLAGETATASYPE